MNKRITVDFNAKITPVKPVNDEFTLCKCYVMALNKNRNLSYISKATADAALPSLFNVPVIGHLYADENGEYHMGGHDMAIVEDEKSDYGWAFKSLCVPYGVVPQQDNVYYEEVTEADGDVNTYLVCDVILWTGRFPELKEAIYDHETYFGQSMEINVQDFEELEEDKNYLNILDYTYSALCLLGKSDNPDEHVEPCFPMARITPHSYALDTKFTELMEELKNGLAVCFENNAGAQTAVAPIAFDSTYIEKRNAIENALPSINDESEISRCVYYWLCDFDDAFAYVEQQRYNGEKWQEAKGRFKYSYNEDERVAAVSGDFEQMFVKWLTKEDLDQIDSQRGELESLTAYKAKREKEDLDTEYKKVIEKFPELSSNEEFSQIVKQKYEYGSIDAFEKEIYALKGRLNIPTEIKKVKEPIVLVGESTINEDKYTIFFKKYSKI